MKKLMMISSLIAAFAITACAQTSKKSSVPSLVENAFLQKFPKASDVEWKQKGDAYVVEFELGGSKNDHEAWLDKEGKLLKHKEEINYTELPAAVKQTLSQQYNGFKTEDYEKIENADGTLHYGVEVEKKPEEYRLLLDSQGKIIEKTVDQD